jgi:hypothetical protein
MTHLKVCDLIGHVIALRCVREIGRNGVIVLRASEADFWIEIEGDATQGIMILWNDDSDKVQQLRIGSVYRFKAAMEKRENGLALHFIPGMTHFHEICGEIVRKGAL